MWMFSHRCRCRFHYQSKWHQPVFSVYHFTENWFSFENLKILHFHLKCCSNGASDTSWIDVIQIVFNPLWWIPLKCLWMCSASAYKVTSILKHWKLQLHFNGVVSRFMPIWGICYFKWEDELYFCTLWISSCGRTRTAWFWSHAICWTPSSVSQIWPRLIGPFIFTITCRVGGAGRLKRCELCDTSSLRDTGASHEVPAEPTLKCTWLLIDI